MRIWITVCLGLLLSFSIYGQNTPVQAIRGIVMDAQSGKPLSGAIVRVGEGPDFRTDEQGLFRIDSVPVGRKLLQVACQGYESFFQLDLLLNAGKELVLEIKLEAKLYEGEEVSIYSQASRNLNRVSTRVFTVEQSKRYAAAYFDPARLAASFPGVVQGNDQTNHLMIRGNSPNGLLWRLEGVDIVNPNHLTNAGTFTDRLTQSGGSTILLSTQLLANSSLSTGAFSAEYGNALSGVFDIHFREGNNEKYEFTGQAGLIGIDVSAEGPIHRKSGSSFLVNYRYSTIGLLTALNVPVGDERIQYQDLAFKLSFPTQNAGTFSLFGMGGLSSNRFEGPRTDSLVQQQKDRFDINYTSNIAASGFTHEYLIKNKSLWRTVIAWSGLFSGRSSQLLIPGLPIDPREQDTLAQQRISLTSSIQTRLSSKIQLKAGFFANYLHFHLHSQYKPGLSAGDFIDLAKGNGGYWLLQPYTNLTWQLNAKFRIQAGLHAMIFLLNKSYSLEPRLSIQWHLKERHQLYLAYGLHSQLQLPTTYFSTLLGPNDIPFQPNLNLGFSKAHHIVLSYHYNYSTSTTLRLEPYYQRLFQIPIGQANPNFSAINLWEGFVQEVLENEGEGLNYGLEFTLDKTLSRGYYYLLSGSLYQALYKSPGQEWLANRFNGNFAFSGTGGWERNYIGKKNKNQTLGLNMRLIYRGGLRTMPIDLDASRLEGRTIFDPSQGFSEQLPDYVRLDFRVTLKRNRQRFTRTLGIDIQNALNTRNIAFEYFDFHLDQIVTQYQLGIIPLLSYRIEF